MSANPTDLEGRLGAMERGFARLSADVENLASSVRTMADGLKGVGKPNYGALSVLIAFAVALASLGAMAVFGPIKAGEKRLDSLDSRLAALRHEHALRIESEITRNNRLEREMGAVLNTQELFRAGRLRLEP